MREIVSGKIKAGRYDFGLRHRDGSLRWVEMQAVPTRYQEKPAMRTVFVDITERKRAEQAYWDLVEHSLQGVAILQGISIVYINPAIEELLGIPKVEVLEMPLLELLSQIILPEDQDAYLRNFWNVRSGQFPTTHKEYRLRRRDGSLRWVEVQNTPTVYQGRPAVQDFFLDITERKLAEEALRASEAAYRQQASELQALYTTSLELNARTEVNEVLQTILEQAVNLSGARGGFILLTKGGDDGLTLSVATGDMQPFIGRQLAHSEGVPSQALSQGKLVKISDFGQWEEHTRFSHQDRRAIGLAGALLAIPMASQQGDLGVLVIYKGSDSTGHPLDFDQNDERVAELFAAQAALALERVRLLEETRNLYQREHQQREELQVSHGLLVQAEKMAALGRLTSSIAHNIGNPLQAIQLSLELAREELENEGRKEQLERYLHIADNRIQGIGRVLDQFRQFYRPHRRGNQGGDRFKTSDFYSGFPFEETDLPEVVRSVLDLVQYQLKEKLVRTVLEVENGLPSLLGVPDLLGQVVLNLAINACDAMSSGAGPRDNTLTIRMHQAVMQPPGSATAGEGVTALRLEIRDNGPGLAPEVRDRIFEPFVTGREEGSGLGLSSAYEIVKAHQGTIQVESSPGQGTAFTILLPLKPYDTAALAARWMA